jgi:hypothetical protein
VAAVFSFKGSQAGIEEFAFGDDDDVEPGRDLVAPKYLSNETLGPIPCNGPPELPGGSNSDPAVR